MKVTSLRVDEFADVYSGGTPSTAMAAFWDGGIPWITPKDLAGYEARYVSSGERDISDEGLRNSSAKLLPAETVVLSTRAPVGYVAIAAVPLATNQGFKNLVCKTGVAVPGFVYYLLKHSTELLESHSTGATFKELSGSRLKAIEFQLPDAESQTRIANILSAYDDLIENNRRRMALLEDAARQLYREWFVRLRFPGHEHTRITNGVPEGWKKTRLSEVADINKESLSGSYDGEIEYIDISSVTPGSINEPTRYDFRDAPSRARRVVRHGDIIWSCVRPNRRSYAVIWQPGPSLIASTGFAVLTPTTVPTAFLLQATTTDAFVGYLENHARGAAYPAVVAGDFERAEVLAPRAALLAVFNDQAEPLLAQASTLRLQNQKLRAARDLLLPRLMSGEIPV